jgi:acyl carrier protein
MTEKEICNLLKKNFKHLKKNKININNDLIKDHIIDSLEFMSFISLLEKKKLFNLKDYVKTKKNFKLSTILRSINKE